MDPDIRRLQSEVAILLACARTRLDKSRWRAILRLLQDAAEQRQEPGLNVGPLLHERAYLKAVIEKSSGRQDAAIIIKQML